MAKYGKKAQKTVKSSAPVFAPTELRLARPVCIRLCPSKLEERSRSLPARQATPGFATFFKGTIAQL